METLQTVFFYSVPVVIGLAAIEAAVLAWRRGRYDWRASLASLADLLFRQYVAGPYLTLSIAAPAFGWAISHRLGPIPLNSALAFVALFLGEELCYYWFHRASHRVRWFWANHAVHHSPNELNLSAAYRFGWTGRLIGATLFYVPLVWLGFPPPAVFATLSLNLLYQFWLHTDWIPKLGPLEYVLNTPSHHRVHHAANPDYLDANYGGVLIVFDRLFGTFVAERADLPCRYGLVEPLRSNNPAFISVHEWLNLARDLTRARSWRERWFYLFGPPGWKPDAAMAASGTLQIMPAAPPSAS
jgi:sterol desaturase/sphingolipid hydroxylase (fatty acid hydroxylase superfamily)